jgi:outer membrane receptor protein involved in Fe transport
MFDTKTKGKGLGELRKGSASSKGNNGNTVLMTRQARYLGAAIMSLIPALGRGDDDAKAIDKEQTLDPITITGERLNLVGEAVTSSQGVVVNDELALTPAYRPGQLLETIPGLVVTSHSGEGKANQYLMRGFNLDHGTDLAIFVDGMPINAPTNAHGQGYTDLNFMIPELATNLAFTKGPYFANVGDFGSIGSVRISYLDSIANQVSATVGTLGFTRLFGAGSFTLGHGQLLGALELQHYDGPWDNPDDQRKINAVLRYSEGEDRQGFSLTAMYYHGLWNATTDQPARAIDEGLISRWGSLDPTDGGQAQRMSVSSQLHLPVGGGQLDACAFLVSSRMTLWNDFTHFLTDTVNGDQEAQNEDRLYGGATIRLSRVSDLSGVAHQWSVGLDTRDDSNNVSRVPTRGRQILPPGANPLGFFETDRVQLRSFSAYGQLTSPWTGWFRTVLGLRQDYVHESDTGTNGGREGAPILEPKGSLIFRPWSATELYLSAGRGFHTDDARGVNIAEANQNGGAPLIAKSRGEEIGVRQQVGQRLAATLTLFRIDFQSETTYDPDAGEDAAGPPSRRTGGELNLTWQTSRWLEFYGSVAATHARYRQRYDDGTGHAGEYIPDAPNVIASMVAYAKNLGAWSGGLEYRYFGHHPLTPDDAEEGDGYGEWNADVRYAFDSGWHVSVGVYNMLGARANAAEFWYIDRLPGERAEGVAGEHIHPLEPFSARLSLGKTF